MVPVSSIPVTVPPKITNYGSGAAVQMLRKGDVTGIQLRTDTRITESMPEGCAGERGIGGDFHDQGLNQRQCRGGAGAVEPVDRTGFHCRRPRVPRTSRF